MTRAYLLPLLATAALAGCVSPREGGRGRDFAPEFVGRPIRVQAASGQISTMFLYPDGTVEARFSGKTTAGRWSFDDGNLCYTWAGNYRECWPHTAPFVPGRTETVRSDRGNIVKVTLE
jgi:hypothetical protein